MNYKIAQLMLSPGKNAQTECDIFVAQVDSHKENLAGKLFMQVEIPKSNGSGLKIIHFLIDTLNRNYYQNEKIYLRERISTLTIEHIFEAALANTNKLFFEYLEKSEIKMDVSSLNLIAGIIHEKNIYFSSSGKISAFLIYKKALDSAEYQITDILKSSGKKGKESKAAQPAAKLFTNVISGQIPENACFFLTNEAIPEYLAQKQLIEILTVLPPISAAEKIKQLLASVNSYISFAGLIIKTAESAPPPAQATPIVQRVKARESIINLNKTENQTEELLNPSGMISPKKWSTRLFARFKTGSAGSGGALAIKDRIFFKRKSGLGARISLLARSIGSLFLLIPGIFAHFKTNLKKNPAPGLSTVPAPNQEKKRALRFFSIFSGLSAKSKTLAASILLIAMFLSLNLYWQKQKQEKEAQARDYAAKLELIEQKQNQAEANMLFSNNDKAIALYHEAKDLLETLPEKTPELSEKAASLDKKFEEFMEKVRKSYPFSGLEKLANYQDILPGAQAVNIVYLPEQNKILASDQANKSLYIYDAKDKIGTVTSADTASAHGYFSPALKDGGLVYYAGDKVISTYEIKTGSYQDIPIQFSAGDIASLQIYNTSAYILNKNDKQIHQYPLSGLSSAPKPWLNAPLAMENPVDLSIDGSVYVLDSSGKALKFLRGAPQEFALQAIDPPLSSADKIWVSKDKDMVYILDKKGQRVILFNKKGEFIKQLKSADLASLDDFAIDEKGKQIFLLNGSELYKAKLE